MTAQPPELDPIQRLRQAQLDRGISDEALANRLNISSKALRRTVYGRRSYRETRGKQFRESLEILAAMRRELKLQWDEIFPED
ncbi:hypothetical protein H6F75_00555 [Nodosilinea sp. FACHB-131]|uniref:hypothetical protein n=1 Tax=Cyanophyceae TaxID=3028117 RepID=UPI00168820CD|nr:hypothetical protein [Nodosilinea sp. FACHB-131]MBD1871961.1 hypothetical protein [Nodosilinea sp. FACHB-131]